jgi:hypothetical protein
MTHQIDSPTDRFGGLAQESLAEASLHDASVEALDSHSDAFNAVQDTLAVTSALEEKLAELSENKVYLPQAGYDKLRREAIEEAKALTGQAQRRFTQSYQAAESAILDSALAKLSTDREALARSELQVAVGDATGPEAKSRILGVAKSGSAEAQAVLGTPFAKTYLISKGVSNVDRLLADARKIIARTGASPEAQRAAAGLDRLAKLGGAQAAAQAAFRHAFGG